MVCYGQPVECLLTPEQFSDIFVQDLNTPHKATLAAHVAEQIRAQCISYAPAAEPDEVPPKSKRFAYDDGITIVIKLDFNIRTMNFRDQFEWPLYSTADPVLFK